ncbi:MAG TPA: hypothetical protein P5568_14345 [Acidobacteriota bacterium]|nr:hypothetical protein [Acidobacteriota bacterium]
MTTSNPERGRERRLFCRCMGCGKVRDLLGRWRSATECLIPAEAESRLQISHGLCPGCAAKFYPEYFPPTVSTS